MAELSSDSQTMTFCTALPRALDSQIHVRLTARAKCLMLFVTTTSAEDGETLAPLGSFVYAVPDRFKPSEPLCTNIYVEENSLEFAARLARLIVKKTQYPVYVSSSLNLDRMGLGGTVEEVLEAFQGVARPLLPLLPRLQKGT